MSFARALAAAHKAAARVDGTKVKIKRGDVTIECVPCLRGSSRFESVSTDNPNVLVEVVSQDLLVLAELYDFGDGPVEPDDGDRFSLTQPDGTETAFELLNLPGEMRWRWSDQYRTRYRLHTKEVSSAE